MDLGCILAPFFAKLHIEIKEALNTHGFNRPLCVSSLVIHGCLVSLLEDKEYGGIYANLSNRSVYVRSVIVPMPQ